MRRFGIFGGSPEYGQRLASTNACCQMGLAVKVKTFRRAVCDLGFAASHNDVKSWHSVLPKRGIAETAFIETPRRRAKPESGQKRNWSNQ
jgi:hypothetical protein